jgi:tetratricopeptide (TPR) repeat protein
MHEMLRQYADAQAAQHPALRAHALERHSRYYLQWLHEQIPSLLNAEQPEAMALIEEDFENVRAGWLWAMAHQEFALLGAAMSGLFHFCHIRSRVLDGVQLLQPCVDQLQAQGVLAVDADPGHRQFLGMLLARIGGLYTNVSSAEGLPLLYQSLQYLNDPCERAFVLQCLGGALSVRGDWARAEAPLRESLILSRARDDLLVQGNALFRLTYIARLRGDILQALALAQECLAVFRASGRPSGISHLLAEVGYLELISGDYEPAKAHLLESLPISRRLGYPIGEANALRYLGFIAWGKGDLEEAVAYMQAALTIHRRVGVAIQIGFALTYLVEVLNDCDVPQQALQYGLESVALARTLLNEELLYSSLRVLGGAQIENSDFAAARLSLKEALSLAWSSEDLSSLLKNIYSQSDLLVRESHFHTAVKAAVVRCQVLEWLVLLQHHPACWQIYKDKAVRLEAEVAAVLPTDQVAAARKRGKTLTLDEVVQFLLRQT